MCASEFQNLCKIIDWNFPGLTIILFRLSQSKPFPDSFSKVIGSASFSFEIEEIVLSSAKLYISEFSGVVSRSFRNILNKIGPKMEPCGTTEISNWKVLRISSILTFCFHLFKYE